MTTEELTDAVLALDGKRGSSKEITDGKTPDLKRVSALGMPVPPAFMVTVDVCLGHRPLEQTLPETVRQEAPARLSGPESAA